MKRFLKKIRYVVKLKNKHILMIMTFLCLSLMVATFSSRVSIEPLRNIAGIFVFPFEKSIDTAGTELYNLFQLTKKKQKLVTEKEALQQKLDDLKAQNDFLLQGQTELTQLRELYQLDQEYGSYPKIMANIIAKDPGNWYARFKIDKGTKDGVCMDSNVLAGKGLVGIVTEVGENWAVVESIINDTSNVSAKTVTTNENCIVEGDLELIDNGLLRFSQLYDIDDKITAGERIVTSHISEKYVEGLFVGYISSIEKDSNNLTKTGTIVTPVSFDNLEHVLVLTTTKEEQTQGGGEDLEE